MQTLTKTELVWIYNAVINTANECNWQMKDMNPKTPAYMLAELHRDNLESVARKLGAVINNNDKRIAIK